LRDKDEPRRKSQLASQLADSLIGKAARRASNMMTGKAQIIPANQQGVEYSRLRPLPLLSSLSDSEVQSLARSFRSLEFKQGAVVIEEGELVTDESMFYLIDRGTVNIVLNGNQVMTRQAGCYFGEKGLLEDQPRSAQIVAASDLVCLCITRGAFQALSGNKRIRRAFDFRMQNNDTHNRLAERESDLVQTLPKTTRFAQ
jgi:CRP-like cAMP-binding protein